MDKVLLSIIGPTAIGKTELSIKIANQFNTEIISADSRQFYKEMQIGTAAPTPAELAAAPHHFIHHKSINNNYSVGDFENDAIKKLNELYTKHNLVILVGGSGLYVNAVTKGLDYFPDIDLNIRDKLNTTYQEKGLHALQEQLKILDPITYKTIALQNPQRVIRALEVCIGTGKPYASFLNKTKNKRHFKTITIGLTANRALIYNRINERVDKMITEGLIKEAKSLYPHKHLNALNTVGYKELFAYFEGNYTLDFAISEIKKNTRRFAKRQLTWFKKNENTLWVDYQTPYLDIIHTIKSEIKKDTT